MDQKKTHTTRFSTAFVPLAKLYGVATKLRNQAYDSNVRTSFQSALPVLSVGNITVGGNGKTPFTAYLAKELFTQGARPVILSRGYGGSEKGPHLASLVDSAKEVGDEVLQHVTQLYPDVPVVVSRDRAEGAQFIEERELGDIVLLDDGFQHRRLRRDMDCILIDVSNAKDALEEWQRGHLLPAGRFREHPRRALERASVVVLVSRGTSGDSSEMRHFLEREFRLSVPIVNICLRPAGVTNLQSGECRSVKDFAHQEVSVFTAIARPTSFVEMLSEAGLRVEKSAFFRDHHLFSDADWATFLKNAKGPIFVTDKDAVKLRSVSAGLERVWVLSLEVAFSELGDDEVFWNTFRSSVMLAKRVEQALG